MSRIFWDTNLFIYLFEDSGSLGARVRSLRERMNDRGDTLLTSALTLGEVLVKPTEAADSGLAQRYRQAISTAATVVAFDGECADTFAALRGTKRLKAPDAVQLACAARAGTDLFITNDARLATVSVPGIQFVTSLEMAPI